MCWRIIRTTGSANMSLRLPWISSRLIARETWRRSQGDLVLLRHKLRRVGKIAWHGPTAWAVSAFARVCDALWARRDFAQAVGFGGAPLPTLRNSSEAAAHGVMIPP